MPADGAPKQLLLERRRSVDAVWEAFLAKGVQPAGLSGEILRSWQRVRDAYRIDPALKRIPRVLRKDELDERRRRSEFLRLARPILADFTARLGLSGHVLSSFDADGTMLSIDGSPATIERVAEIDFRPGASWAEDSAGTNGPGTALAERRPVEVFASEHYVAAWQPWTCSAAPIFAPGDPVPIGIIDLTGPWEVQRRSALAIASAIARAVEERLRGAAGVRSEVVRFAFRAARCSGDAILAVDGRGRVIAQNEAAQRLHLAESGNLLPGAREALARAFASPAHGDEIPLSLPPARDATVTPVLYEDLVVGGIARIPSRRREPAVRRHAATHPARYDFERIQGRSAPLRMAVEIARTAASNSLPVVLGGESGTGKELFAHAIHSASLRSGGPLVVVHCGAIPAQLVEAELFGYEPGTFTGGRSGGNPGRFEDADGGTLFLDEVSELAPAAQTALLRVLQEKEVVRLGGSAPRQVDVRIVAASNKPLDEEIRKGRFRRDLYYRLNVLPIAIPALRERPEDIELLAQTFLEEAERAVGRSGLSLSAAALAALRAHSWPGNVRELRNVILRASATSPREEIRPEDITLEADIVADVQRVEATCEPPPPKPVATLRDAVGESERTALLAALEESGWNFVRAAGALGVSRMTVYRRLARFGIARRA
ncbi:MAG: sigma-54-dependent Fis family transcriptional regulator [Deltaproteobacteria bacterium]|nr:MAG: sigma-54-dependent Fis family transcriptional regulator [Deltaproteobacteria bacterium]